MSIFPRHKGECETDCPSDKTTENCKGPWMSGLDTRVFGGQVIICGDFNIKPEFLNKIEEIIDGEES